MSLSKLIAAFAVAVSALTMAAGTATAASSQLGPGKTLLLPDLYVTSVTTRGFVIRNIGNSPARASVAYVAAGQVLDTCDDVVRAQLVSVPRLEAGASFDVHVPASSTPRRIALDATYLVRESNERNNTAVSIPGEEIIC
jgi:hypothetical protein